MKIRLTENQLKKILAKTLNESMDEWQTIMRFPQGYVSKKGEDWKKDRIGKEAEKNPKLDPAGFQWFGDELRHNEKPRPKSAPKPKAPVISKPDGMSDEEYEQKLVIPNNEKYREKLGKYDDEEFRPIVNGGRYFGGAVDYGCDYEVSNRARLKVLNHANVIKSDIYEPYPAPGKKAMQFTMAANDENGERMRTTPSVAYMVANAFLGEHDPSRFIVVHKDGDWKNNNVENLEWVESGRVGKFGKFKQVAESVKLNETQLRSIVAESVKKVIKEWTDAENNNTMEVYKPFPQNYLQRVMSSNKYKDYDWMAARRNGASMHPGKIVAFGSPEQGKQVGDWVTLKITVNQGGVSKGRNCLLVEPSAIVGITPVNDSAL